MNTELIKHPSACSPSGFIVEQGAISDDYRKFTITVKKRIDLPDLVVDGQLIWRLLEAGSLVDPIVVIQEGTTI